MHCIFCRQAVTKNATEHVLPESLGGKAWACLPPGLVCAGCNQYFGSKVEPLALGSFPFLPFRLFLGIPTKHKKRATMRIPQGIIRSGENAGLFEIQPASQEIEAALQRGQFTRITILAEPTEPVAVCRLLLKMGLEVIARDSAVMALDKRFDDARQFARKPCRGSRWWFLLHIEREALFAKLKGGLNLAEWVNGVRLETVDEQGALVFRLKLLDLTMIAPLGRHIQPPTMHDLPEPACRLFRVQC
jgi:hypothetical protein